MRSFVIDEYMLLSDYCAAGAKTKRDAANEEDAKKYDGAQEFMDKYLLQIIKDAQTLTNVIDKKC